MSAATLRSLADARAALLEASRAFGEIGEGSPEWGGARGSQVRIAAILDRVGAMEERERGRHPSGTGACPEEEACGECARAYALPDGDVS